MAPVPVLRALLSELSRWPEARLVIDVHHDVADDDGARHDAEVMGEVRRAASHPQVELHVHDCYSDDELWAYLGGVDLSVLPYSFGTHSGWLEACHDLGTAVLAPECGYLHEQRRCLTYRPGDAASIVDAVCHAVTERPRWQASRTGRTIERARVAAAHRAVYEQVLGR